jgi:hypothetical protein
MLIKTIKDNIIAVLEAMKNMVDNKKIVKQK